MCTFNCNPVSVEITYGLERMAMYVQKVESVFDIIWNTKLLAQKQLTLPAYDQCIKASHVFNLLDARGVISVAQRADYIARVRILAKSCGQSWLQQYK